MLVFDWLHSCWCSTLGEWCYCCCHCLMYVGWAPHTSESQMIQRTITPFSSIECNYQFQWNAPSQWTLKRLRCDQFAKNYLDIFVSRKFAEKIRNDNDYSLGETVSLCCVALKAPLMPKIWMSFECLMYVLRLCMCVSVWSGRFSFRFCVKFPKCLLKNNPKLDALNELSLNKADNIHERNCATIEQPPRIQLFSNWIFKISFEYSYFQKIALFAVAFWISHTNTEAHQHSHIHQYVLLLFFRCRCGRSMHTHTMRKNILWYWWSRRVFENRTAMKCCCCNFNFLVCGSSKWIKYRLNYGLSITSLIVHTINPKGIVFNQKTDFLQNLPLFLFENDESATPSSTQTRSV